MKIDAVVTSPELTQMPHLAGLADEIGLDGLYVAEKRRDPFLQVLAAAGASSRVELGTAIALALTRNPLHVASTANDLQEYSKGRFILGIGSQVKAHVEKRFGTAFTPPVPRMREFVQALHEIWDCWQKGERLNHHGDYYRHTIMTPDFTPPRHDHGRPRVFLGGVGPRMVELAGECADGLFCHSFLTARYLQDTMIPALERGLRAAGRTRQEVEVVSPGFVVTGATEEAYARAEKRARRAVAFFGATPSRSYQRVFESHGWGSLQAELNTLARERRWEELPKLIDDEMLNTFATCGEPERIPDLLAARFGPTCQRVLLAVPFHEDPETWSEIVTRTREISRSPG